MLPRRETAERKELMLRDLRDAYRLAAVEPGQMAVSQRELSTRYGLSLRTVALEMQKLVDEGVLYIVPRVGTFVGRPNLPQPNCYLLVLPPPLDSGGYSDAVNDARRGFEERIAELGASTVTMSTDLVRDYVHSGDLPPLSGVFQWTDLNLSKFVLPGEDGTMVDRLTAEGGLFSANVSRVRFGRLFESRPGEGEATIDAVDFDNRAGGEQAARHLLEMGHRQIAFLGLHSSQGCTERDRMFWSFEREQGWKSVLEKAGGSSRGLSFLPQGHCGTPQWEQVNAAAEACQELIKNTDFTAVVAVNHLAGKVLLDQLKAAIVPPRLWPAIVCFDDYAPTDEHILSSFNLPYSALGRLAAQLLWDRHNGKLTGPAQRKTVQLRLVRRLSCREDWRQPGSLRGMRSAVMELAGASA